MTPDLLDGEPLDDVLGEQVVLISTALAEVEVRRAQGRFAPLAVAQARLTGHHLVLGQRETPPGWVMTYGEPDEGPFDPMLLAALRGMHEGLQAVVVTGSLDEEPLALLVEHRLVEHGEQWNVVDGERSPDGAPVPRQVLVDYPVEGLDRPRR